jgi:hypothetical protein
LPSGSVTKEKFTEDDNDISHGIKASEEKLKKWGCFLESYILHPDGNKMEIAV